MEKWVEFSRKLSVFTLFYFSKPACSGTDLRILHGSLTQFLSSPSTHMPVILPALCPSPHRTTFP